jgi:hypothetical protein
MQASTGIASTDMCPHAGQVISEVVVTERFAFTLVAWQPMWEVVREAGGPLVQTSHAYTSSSTPEVQKGWRIRALDRFGTDGSP